MDDKRRRFATEYLVDLNATQAALRAGYSPKSAYSQGHRLLKNAEVAKWITEGKGKQLAVADLSAVRVLEELRRLGFSDVKRLFDESGNLRPVHTLPDEDSAAISSVEVVKKNLAAGDGKTDTVHKLKVWDKPRSLEVLAKHFGLLVERLEASGNFTYKWQD